MKRCPSCNRTYTDTSLNFCLEDGTPLVADAPPPADPNATMRYPAPRDTSEPPPTEIYRPDSPLINPRQTAPPPPPPLPQQQWSPTPSAAPQKKSNALWWVLGGIAAIAVIGVGLVVMIIALASMGGNTNTNGNSNVRIVNRNTNTAPPNTNSSPNANTTTVGDSLSDNFSEQKWGIGNSGFGRIWYTDEEYHMSSKEKTYVVMYAPSDEYGTENATVKVTARSVDGTAPSAGFGLMVHCAQSKAKHLEDYALLIYPSDDPEYEVIMHKDGNQSSLISKTKSSAIRSGTSPNQLEIRVKGTEISFYINGQYLNRITDAENFKRGRAGLYTSDVTEVAFDDLEIER
jgi:uncharacterized protein YlbG (UPF0298 family)